jgi:hypothetical protein
LRQRRAVEDAVGPPALAQGAERSRSRAGGVGNGAAQLFVSPQRPLPVGRQGGDGCGFLGEQVLEETAGRRTVWQALLIR